MPKRLCGGYCRLQMLLELALGVRGTVAGHRLGALEGGGGATPLPIHPWGFPPLRCFPQPSPTPPGRQDIERTASVRCVTACSLFRLDKDVFKDCLRKFPEFAATIVTHTETRFQQHLANKTTSPRAWTPPHDAESSSSSDGEAGEPGAARAHPAEHVYRYGRLESDVSLAPGAPHMPGQLGVPEDYRTPLSARSCGVQSVDSRTSS